ncbi:asparagine-tRNA ligase [Allomyces macrogynus ATCC 38327]|uniref:asparagine--tRNA ligase n=1 Tax=Allomyces macrogynus (strain ATCC 38327) TaxID=578462 RepID=A0A0L0T451_ALLM3|nr:asparagine-tRNA ligase [Allomyces macrogynus ATCC 38327]|eukprot:KNE69480.1 asparagine-tRNA ligase [Allomyces macrogynus ATCC 38327]
MRSSYPLQKKRHGVDFLREITHLRPRTNTFAAAARVRNDLFFGLHNYFAHHGFLHIHTPILTASDCEGAGETFEILAPADTDSPDREGPCSDYFGTPRVNLTVSGQLHLEMFAHAHPRVYTFSPSFRAEKTLSTRHLAEFAMLEAEMTFIDDLDTLLDVTTAMVRDAVTKVNPADLELLAQLAPQLASSGSPSRGKLDAAARAEHVRAAMHRVEQLAGEYAVMTYTEAVQYLAAHPRAPKWQYPVRWGSDLQAEHEKFLGHQIGRPVYVTHYPRGLKPFYMLVDRVPATIPDGVPVDPDLGGDFATVANYDLLVPDLGELLGGSLREHDADALEAAMQRAGLNVAAYQWYLDLRRYGGAPHGGFGLGFDRLVKHVTGLESVRDVVPVPRYYRECRY